MHAHNALPGKACDPVRAANGYRHGPPRRAPVSVTTSVTMRVRQGRGSVKDDVECGAVALRALRGSPTVQICSNKSATVLSAGIQSCRGLIRPFSPPRAAPCAALALRGGCVRKLAFLYSAFPFRTPCRCGRCPPRSYPVCQVRQICVGSAVPAAPAARPSARAVTATGVASQDWADRDWHHWVGRFAPRCDGSGESKGPKEEAGTGKIRQDARLPVVHSSCSIVLPKRVRSCHV